MLVTQVVQCVVLECWLRESSYSVSCLVSYSVSCWNVAVMRLMQCVVPRTCRAVCRAGMLVMQVVQCVMQYISCAAWNLSYVTS